MTIDKLRAYKQKLAHYKKTDWFWEWTDKLTASMNENRLDSAILTNSLLASGEVEEAKIQAGYTAGYESALDDIRHELKHLDLNALRGIEITPELQNEAHYKGISGLTTVHDSLECYPRPCSVHNPSDEAKKIGHLHWRADRQMTERICKCGVGHPDPDEAYYLALKVRDEGMPLQYWQNHLIHGCCSEHCCKNAYEAARQIIEEVNKV